MVICVVMYIVVYSNELQIKNILQIVFTDKPLIRRIVSFTSLFLFFSLILVHYTLDFTLTFELQ